MKANFHMHSTGSDGSLSSEEVILEAIKCGITHMCLTDHSALPGDTNFGWAGFYPDSHYEEIIKLKEKYKSKINIYVGVEIDWIKGYSSWCEKETKKRKYDFVIGSVHGIFVDGLGFVDIWNVDKVKEAVKLLGGNKGFVKEFYSQVREMIKSELFDCVGHLDVLKVKNKDNWLFSEDEEWYLKEILETLDVLKNSKMCLEINTKGIYILGDGNQYPSEWILKEARKRGIPITIGTDFHRLGDNDPIDKAYGLAKKLGYESILIFKDRKSQEMKI